jgi:hypothetical protein
MMWQMLIGARLFVQSFQHSLLVGGDYSCFLSSSLIVGFLHYCGLSRNVGERHGQAFARSCLHREQAVSDLYQNRVSRGLCSKKRKAALTASGDRSHTLARHARAEREESSQSHQTLSRWRNCRRRTRCLVPLLAPLLHLGSVRYHTMTGSRTRDEDDQVLGTGWWTNTLQIDMLPAGASVMVNSWRRKQEL